MRQAEQATRQAERQTDRAEQRQTERAEQRAERQAERQKSVAEAQHHHRLLLADGQSEWPDAQRSPPAAHRG